jgi:hypothetical protein
LTVRSIFADGAIDRASGAMPSPTISTVRVEPEATGLVTFATPSKTTSFFTRCVAAASNVEPFKTLTLLLLAIDPLTLSVPAFTSVWPV